MIELDDCGKDMLLSFGSGEEQMDCTVAMVVKAPRGTMALFDLPFYPNTDTQCEAMRAFMEEHKND